MRPALAAGVLLALLLGLVSGLLPGALPGLPSGLPILRDRPAPAASAPRPLAGPGQDAPAQPGASAPRPEAAALANRPGAREPGPAGASPTPHHVADLGAHGLPAATRAELLRAEAATARLRELARDADALIAFNGVRSTAHVAAAQGQPAPPPLARETRRPGRVEPDMAVPVGAADAELPLFPGAALQADQSARLQDGEVEHVVVSLASGAPLAQVAAFYRAQLAPMRPTQLLQSMDDGRAWRLVDPARRQLQAVRLVGAEAGTVIELTNTRWR